MGLAEKFASAAADATQKLSFELLPSSYVLVGVDEIETDRAQPRRSPGRLEDLADSVGRHGIIQPLMVSPLPNGRFRIIVGERRYRAAIESGHRTVPVVIRTIDESKRIEIQIIENLHREGLSPFDEGTAYQRMMTELGLTHEEIAARIKRCRSYVTQMVSLTNIPDDVRSEIPPDIAKDTLFLIARQEDSAAMRRLLQECGTTRTKEEIRTAAKALKEKPQTPSKSKASRGKDTAGKVMSNSMTENDSQISRGPLQKSTPEQQAPGANLKAPAETGAIEYEVRLVPVHGREWSVPEQQRLATVVKLLRAHGLRCISFKQVPHSPK